MSQFIEMFGNPLSLNQKNELKRLGECCILNPRRPNIALCDTDKVSFIPMPAVSEDGYLVDMTDEEYGKVKKSFTYFENNDVLFAKITPCMENGKGAIVHGLTNGIGMGSTEFHVLRPINGISSPYWLLALTRMPIFRERAAKNMSGTGGQKRVSASYLDHFMVGLPAIEEQRRFEAIYRQADKSKFGDFKSQFIEMFGNPLSLNQKNELKRLGECCILNPRRPNIALCDTDKVSFIPMPAVSEDGYLVDMTDEEYGKVKKSFTYFENNDVLFAKITPCMENGKGAIVHGLTNGIGMGSTEFHVLRPINGISSPYWLLALTRMPIFRERAAKNMSGTGGQKRVSASYLDHFMVGLPAIEEQRRFEAIYRQADKSKSVIQKALVYLNDIQSDELGKIA